MSTTPGSAAERSARQAPRCRGCRSRAVVPVLDLGEQAASDYFPLPLEPAPDPVWPLELWLCEDCRLVQLGPVEPLLPEPMLAIESATSRRLAQASVEELVARYPDLVGSTVFEFKSHHGGSWSPSLESRGCQLVAAGSDRRARLVVDVHALAHEPDVDASLQLRRGRLASDGLLVLECHHLTALVREGQFDTVRHGHWSYLSLSALARLADRHGLEVVRAEQTTAFGGSLRATLAWSGAHPVDASVSAVLREEEALGIENPAGLRVLQERTRAVAGALRDELVALRAAGCTVLAYGAPSKATVLLGVAGIGRDLVDFTVDASPDKHGRLVPGVRLPIHPVADLVAARPDVVLLLTWDIADEVVGDLEGDGGWGASYLLPFPTPHVRDGAGAAAASR